MSASVVISIWGVLNSNNLIASLKIGCWISFTLSIFSSWEYAEFGVARAGAGFAEELKRRLDTEGKFAMEFASDLSVYRTPDKPKGRSEPAYRIKIWEIPAD